MSDDYKKIDVARFTEDEKKNPFFKGMSNTSTPASYASIMIKALLLFALAIFVGWVPAIQDFMYSIWGFIYGNGLLLAIIFIGIYSVIVGGLITFAMRLQLMGKTGLAFLGAVMFAIIQGFIISTVIAWGGHYTLAGYNVALLAVVIVLVIIFVCMIASNFVVFSAEKASKMVTIIIIASLVSFGVWILSMLIPSIGDAIWAILYLGPLGILLSFLIIGFLSYVIMGVMGFLRTNINRFDKKVEWFCASVVLYLFIKLYVAVVKLLVRLVARSER